MGPEDTLFHPVKVLQLIEHCIGRYTDLIAQNYYFSIELDNPARHWVPPVHSVAVADTLGLLGAVWQ
jgi:hypothetical protein